MNSKFIIFIKIKDELKSKKKNYGADMIYETPKRDVVDYTIFKMPMRRYK